MDDAQQAVLGEVAEVVHEAFEELPVVLQRPGSSRTNILYNSPMLSITRDNPSGYY